MALKRKASGGGNEWEWRNNKVQKKTASFYPAWFIEGLGGSDVWKHIGKALRMLQWMDQWKAGRILMLRCEFDNGDLLCSEWKEIRRGSLGVFNCWWGFLERAKVIKRERGYWTQLTISSSYYWQIYSERVHKWESFHIGSGTIPGSNAFEIVEGEEDELVDN